MDTSFRPFLRYDKMGIDYSRITYQHQAPDRSDTPIDPKEVAYLRDKMRRNIEERKKYDPLEEGSSLSALGSTQSLPS